MWGKTFAVIGHLLVDLPLLVAMYVVDVRKNRWLTVGKVLSRSSYDILVHMPPMRLRERRLRSIAGNSVSPDGILYLTGRRVLCYPAT
jgi:hypothetical protein